MVVSDEECHLDQCMLCVLSVSQHAHPLARADRTENSPSIDSRCTAPKGELTIKAVFDSSTHIEFFLVQQVLVSWLRGSVLNLWQQPTGWRRTFFQTVDALRPVGSSPEKLSCTAAHTMHFPLVQVILSDSFSAE